MTQWKTEPLGNLCYLITDGKHGDCVNEDNSGFFFISAKDIRGGKINYENARQIREKDFLETHRRTDLKPGDILLTNSGTIGRLAIAADDEVTSKTTFQKSVAVLKPKQQKVLSRFLYYFLAANSRVIVNAAAGAAQKNLLLGELRRLAIAVPPLGTQGKIANILCGYDVLITNNQRRMELLEQSARLLFKEWFVNQRYPGHEHHNTIDGVPKGWGRSTNEAVCQEFIDGDWLESKDQGGDSFRILQISNIGENAFVETGNYRYITDETFRRLNCCEIVPGDILISRMPEPIGRAWLVTKKPWRMVTAVDGTIARPDISKVDPLYFLHHLNSKVNLARCAGGASGATRPRIAKRVMGGLPILLPPRGLQDDFGSFALAVNEMKERLGRQTDKLMLARDLLLPRLMDGKLSV